MTVALGRTKAAYGASGFVISTLTGFASPWRPKTCQFIAGDPSADDKCKCGAKLKPGSSYCPEHDAMCWGRAA